MKKNERFRQIVMTEKFIAHDSQAAIISAKLRISWLLCATQNLTEICIIARNATYYCSFAKTAFY